MENKQAEVLENCTISDFFTIFAKKPKATAKAANAVLNELNFSELRRYICEEIDLMLDNVIAYKPAKYIKLQEVRRIIDEIKGKNREVTMEEYNLHVLNVFKINEIQVNKQLSMLDFYNLEQNAIKISKK